METLPWNPAIIITGATMLAMRASPGSARAMRTARELADPGMAGRVLEVRLPNP